MPRPGRLYVMAMEEGRKVGFSTNPERRRLEFRSAQIEFVSGWRDDISRAERVVHNILKERGVHVKGEIFDAALEDIVAVINSVFENVDFHVAQDRKTRVRLKKLTTFALDPDLLDRLEKWRQAQDVPPSKTAVLEVAVREFLERREQKGKR